MQIINKLALLISLAISVSFQQPRTLKVLCIGDSITQGKVTSDSISELSYRFWLWEKLDSAGYHVDMLGSNNRWFNEHPTNSVAIPVSQYTGNMFDRDHEGFYGIKSGESLLGGFTHDSVTYPSLHNRLLQYDKADVAFIQIGGNDEKSDSITTINNLKRIVEELYARNKDMQIILSKLICPWIVYINHSIEPIIAALKLKHPGIKLTTVDLASGWVNCPEAPGACTLDWVHPNTTGQKQMADKWFKAFSSAGDKEKPGFKPNITVSAITDSTATIHWNAATDNKFVQGYTIFLDGKPANWRYSECGKHDKQCISLVPGTSYLLTGLQKGKKYTVSVAAVDYADNYMTSKDFKLLIP